MGGGEGLSRATATALVTAGSEILQRLEQLGPNELLRLNIDELDALLVYDDPQGTIPKPIKETRLEKANLMPTIQAAIFSVSNSNSICHASSAATSNSFCSCDVRGRKHSKFAG